MTRTLSDDLRRRVFEAVEGGMSRRSAAERFGVGVATAIRWVQRWRSSGSWAARSRGGNQRSHAIDAYRDEILDLVTAKPDTTLTEISTRLRGRAARGERCGSPIPHGHWKTTTFVGALRLSGMTAPMTLDGAMNGPAFITYVEQVLVPTLRPGDVVVMDNLPAHKPAAVRQAIEPAGAELRFLPPDSPDFNPIEMAFSKIKASPRRPPPGHSAIFGMPFVTLSSPSHPTKPETTSPQRDTILNDLRMLQPLPAAWSDWLLSTSSFGKTSTC